MRFISYPVLALFLITVGCGSADSVEPLPPVGHPKLLEIEMISTYDNDTHRSRGSLDYDGGRLISFTAFADGAVSGRWDFSYDRGLVSNVQITDGQGGPTVDEWDFRHGAFGVSGYSATFPGGLSIDADIRYSHGSVSDWTVNQVGAFGNASATTRFDYDKYTRVKEVEYANGSLIQTTEFEYDAGGLLEAIRYLADGATIRFHTNDNGQVDRVTVHDGTRWDIDYNDAGLIDRATHVHSRGRNVYRYTYGSGNIEGIVPSPSFAWGMYFDMTGRPLSRIEVLTTSLLGLN